MAREGLRIGEVGNVHIRADAYGVFFASARARVQDGRIRQFTARGGSKTAARRALLDKIEQRAGDTEAGLSGETLFPELLAEWLQLKAQDGSVRPQSVERYRQDATCLAPLGHLRLRELTVARLDRLILDVAKESVPKSRRARNVLRQSLALAVRRGALPTNPMAAVSRVSKRARREVVAFSVDEIRTLRSAVGAFLDRREETGRRQDRQLTAVVDLLIATGLRVNELLALRVGDLDDVQDPTTISVDGTIVYLRGTGLVRQPEPKTASGARAVVVPGFARGHLRRRIAAVAGQGPEALLFQTKKGTPLSAANLRRDLRAIYSAAALPNGGQPFHVLRKAASTLVYSEHGAAVVAQMLGHADEGQLALSTYVQRSREANAVTAEVLDRLIGTA